MSASRWIRILLLVWAVWILFMMFLSNQATPVWIARDAITRNTTFIDLEALIPVRDGLRVRIATTAPGLVPPAPVAVKNGRMQTRVPIPEDVGTHGMHLWSALPATGEAPPAISNGTLTILDPHAPWIAIDIDPFIADRPWSSLGTEDPPLPLTPVLDGLLQLSQHAVIVCSTRLQENQLPLFRQWWDLHSFPVSVIFPETDLISLSEELTVRLGPPVLRLIPAEKISNDTKPIPEISPAIAISGDPAEWQQIETRLLDLLALEERKNR